MIKVELLIYNFSESSFHYQKFLTEIIEKTIRTVLPKINSSIKNVNVSLILLSPKVSLQLNKIWRKKGYIPADLSFPNCGKLELKKSKESSIILGDIFLTPKVIKGKEEYRKMTIHSLLHLLGYDHETKKDEQEMQRIEQTL